MKNIGFQFLVVFCLIGLFVFCGIDYCTGTNESSYSAIVNKYYVPERKYSTVEIDEHTGITTIEEHKIPEQWNVDVIYRQNQVTINTGHIMYNKLNVGESVPVITTLGGISGMPYNYRIVLPEIER
jgi:hypothetical protein